MYKSPNPLQGQGNGKNIEKCMIYILYEQTKRHRWRFKNFIRRKFAVINTAAKMLFRKR